jgi:hypothetical protein
MAEHRTLVLFASRHTTFRGAPQDLTTMEGTAMKSGPTGNSDRTR